MNRFLSETGNKVQAHKGVFWLIEDKLLTFREKQISILSFKIGRYIRSQIFVERDF